MSSALSAGLDQVSAQLLRARPEDLVRAADTAAELLDHIRLDPSPMESEALQVQLWRMRELAWNAEQFYLACVTITAAKTAGYDRHGAPAVPDLGCISIEG